MHLGTRVKLATAIGNYPAGTEGVIVREFAGDVCEVMVGDDRLTISYSALVPVAPPALPLQPHP